MRNYKLFIKYNKGKTVSRVNVIAYENDSNTLVYSGCASIEINEYGVVVSKVIDLTNYQSDEHILTEWILQYISGLYNAGFDSYQTVENI
jgi:hypothetical protein